MNNHDLITFLSSFDDNEEVKVWVKIGKEELSEPNMATIERDEIFKFQDQLDEIALTDDNVMTIFNFADNLLDELESRLQLSPSFIKEMEEIHQKIEDDDFSDFTPVDLSHLKKTFNDCVNSYHTARTIRDLNDAERSIILCARDKLGDQNIYIRNNILFIEQRNNISCSTSIIADLLGINSRRINDKQWLKGIWSINLKEI